MSRRKARQASPAARSSLLGGWTISRATGVGIVSGVLALLLAALFGSLSDAIAAIYVMLLLVTALCGASILCITALDIRARGTRGKMRAVRGFDIAVGLALLLPTLYALRPVWAALGL